MPWLKITFKSTREKCTRVSIMTQKWFCLLVMHLSIVEMFLTITVCLLVNCCSNCPPGFRIVSCFVHFHDCILSHLSHLSHLLLLILEFICNYYKASIFRAEKISWWLSLLTFFGQNGCLTSLLVDVLFCFQTCHRPNRQYTGKQLTCWLKWIVNWILFFLP